MSSKINIQEIIRGHIKTLIDSGKNKASLPDIFSFFIFPAILSVVGIYFKLNINKEIISLLVNFGAIFTALLLSVLVLVYDQENKINTENKTALINIKKNLLKQLYYNICYCIIISVALVVTCLIHSISSAEKLNIYFTSPIITLFTSNLVLTILMVVKRMHTLLISE